MPFFGHVFETQVREASRGLTMKMELWFDNARDRSPCFVVVIFLEVDKRPLGVLLFSTTKPQSGAARQTGCGLHPSRPPN